MITYYYLCILPFGDALPVHSSLLRSLALPNSFYDVIYNYTDYWGLTEFFILLLAVELLLSSLNGVLVQPFNVAVDKHHLQQGSSTHAHRFPNIIAD